MLKRTLYGLAAVGAALALTPESGTAQRAAARAEADAPAAAASRGWIGISFEVRTNSTGSRFTVVLTEVTPGAPARAAGLRQGDLLLAINGVESRNDFENINTRLLLDPGDPVHVVFIRNDEVHTVDLRAADRERPRSSTVFTLRFQPDSMIETSFRAMDSLRLRLEQAARIRSVQVVTQTRERSRPVMLSPRVPGVTVAPPPDVRFVFPRLDDMVQGWASQEMRAPFGFFVFRGEQHDSLQREMDELNRLFREARGREAERLRYLNRVSGTLRGNENDNQLLQIRGAIEQLSERSQRLRKSMTEETVSTAGTLYGVASTPPRGVPLSDALPVTKSGFRPLAPYLLGQNRAAGAELLDMSPEMDEVFDVDGGVLVTEVLTGTPAALAGIKPGDVIVRVDQIAVRSIEGLQLALSRAGSGIPLTLMRRGVTRTVLLREVGGR